MSGANRAMLVSHNFVKKHFVFFSDIALPPNGFCREHASASRPVTAVGLFKLTRFAENG